ncbi:E3 ubiquitin-protein ligase WAV3-like [Silene latifolia]|uniref:E3 ubiquitin-protein ligase WAV3-like n=1 Tax=Silene latifolia TaxID=37657 RepID=UPI003D77D424
MNSSKDECAICLENLKAREGQALFTAECSHTFHFNCIASNVQHGNHICPTCRCQWTNLPSQFVPPDPVPPPITRRVRNPQPYSPVSNNFADDEPLPSTDDSSAPLPQVDGHQGGQMTVKALPEFPALSRSEQSDSFPVLIGIRAPPLSPEASDRPDARAPVDLVAVLDISGSMNGDKIRLLKQAMGFVVDNLGPTDRLSVIVFSTTARRITPLRRMTDLGRTDTMREVNSLRVTGATNIIAGLKLAVQVLEQRTQKNSVASIILLSDGQDNQNGSGAQFLQALANLPPCIRANVPDQDSTDVVPVPVHTFGFGSDHDATALHAIADGSGGTFSYIESIEIIQDAFAQCIGGLLSVVGQEVEIHVHSGSSRVQIQSISSGRYRNTIDNDGNQHGIVYVGDIYAEEEKQFLVNLSVPQEDTDSLTTKLVEVKCSYKDPISNESIISETMTVEIRRPTTEDLSEEDRQVCLEVDRERNRILIAEGIAEAQEMAERGELEDARELLGQRRVRIMASYSAQAGDRYSTLLDGEVRHIQERWSSRAEYESGGRALAFSKGNAHRYQRASTQAVSLSNESLRVSNSSMVTSSFSAAAAAPDESGYQTSFMRKMVTKSRELRNSGNQGEQSGGSKN